MGFDEENYVEKFISSATSNFYRRKQNANKQKYKIK